MQFLRIDNSMRLSDLADIVGSRNVESVLQLNNIPRVPEVGQAYTRMCDSAISSYPEPTVSWDLKKNILNNMTQDYDVFQAAALGSEDDWKLLATMGSFPDYVQVPDYINLPASVDTLGDGQGVPKSIYDSVMSGIDQINPSIDPGVFNEFSSRPGSTTYPASTSGGISDSGSVNWFPIPLGKITLYSSIDGSSIDFPCYPEGFSDGRQANFTTMPDMLMQYEPWYIYQSSGPREVTFRFDIHRDMWSGNHMDGKFNDLRRACEANCYPEFSGSAVNVPRVTLYINGEAVITGIMTSVEVEWDKESPLGQDNWYLHCYLSLNITEIAEEALDFNAIKSKSLIG